AYQPIALLNPNSWSFVDGGLSPQVSYSYRVVAIGSAAQSEYSNLAAGATLAVTPPAILVALPSKINAIALSWSDADPQYVDHYNIYRSTSRAIPLDVAHRVGSTGALAFEDETVEPGVRYFYRVTAVNAAGSESTASNLDGTNTIPTTPFEVVASVSGPSDLDITFYMDDGSAVDHYDFYRGATANFANAVLRGSNNRAFFSDHVEDPAATYYYFVKAVNVAGIASAASAAGKGTVMPAGVTGLNAWTTGGTVHIGWSYDAPWLIDHYNVYRSDAPVFAMDAAHRIGETAGLEFLDAGVDNRTWYYRVTAVNAVGVESAASAVTAGKIDTSFAALDGSGTLVVTGRGASDLVSLWQSGEVLYAALNGTVVSYSASAVSRIHVQSMSGNDTLYVNDVGEIPVTFESGPGLNTLYVAGGTLHVEGDLGAGTARVGVEVGSGAAVVFEGSERLEFLHVAANGRVAMSGPVQSYLMTKDLGIKAGGVMDIGVSDLILDFGPGVNPLAAVQDWVISGFGFSVPLTGITSSSIRAREGTAFLTLFDPSALGLEEWDGMGIDATTIVGKYTIFGDADLDGTVTGQDREIVMAKMGKEGHAFWEGDMNLDGVVTTEDLLAVDSNMGLSVYDAPVARQRVVGVEDEVDGVSAERRPAAPVAVTSGVGTGSRKPKAPERVAAGVLV
ncbi:MAG TPA: hypothetical protein VF669_00340, partial [Tepidisphaeraceae bacterium]